MRTLICCAAVAAAALTRACTAQETIVTPRPSTQTASDANSWRYRWHEGHWWYWTPQNRWMWYSDERRWIEYDPSHAPPAADQSAPLAEGYYGDYSGPVYYPYSGPAYYYPGPGYWGRYYYPGVAVGVGPYGSVGVGVGPRLGVDVWGPHGGVRVGGLHVGW